MLQDHIGNITSTYNITLYDTSNNFVVFGIGSWANLFLDGEDKLSISPGNSSSNFNWDSVIAIDIMEVPEENLSQVQLRI